MRNFVLCLFFLVSPAFAAGPVHISSAWTTPAGLGEDTVVYLTVVNTGLEAEHLLRVETPVAARAELRQAIAGRAGIIRLQQVPEVRLNPVSVTQFRPDTLILFLKDLQKPLALGESIPVHVFFKNAGEQKVRVEVRAGTS